MERDKSLQYRPKWNYQANYISQYDQRSKVLVKTQVEQWQKAIWSCRWRSGSLCDECCCPASAKNASVGGRAEAPKTAKTQGLRRRYYTRKPTSTCELQISAFAMLARHFWKSSWIVLELHSVAARWGSRRGGKTRSTQWHANATHTEECT